MPGFMSSNASMIICKIENPKPLDMDKLRSGAFSEAIDSEGRRLGWVGLGDMLDTENFSLALCDGRFAGFSFRLDARKPSAAVARLQLAEKIREEELEGKKVGPKRKRELREAIMEKLASEADFAPSLVDCLWDGEKGRLFIGASGEKAALPVLEHFKNTFGMEAWPIEPEKDMPAVFASIQQGEKPRVGPFAIQPTGDATLSSEADKEKSLVSALNNPEAIEKGLADGLIITKEGMEAVNEEEGASIFFTVDSALRLTGLRLPKAEKGADPESVFIVNADICANVADIVENLAGCDQV